MTAKAFNERLEDLMAVVSAAGSDMARVNDAVGALAAALSDHQKRNREEPVLRRWVYELRLGGYNGLADLLVAADRDMHAYDLCLGKLFEG